MEAEVFREWWGRTNLPPALQIITYGGASLNLDGDGDGIGLFNMGATDDTDLVIFGSFSTTPRGVSWVFDIANPDFYCCYLLAAPGVNGAFIASQGGDIGSPGYIDTPSDPRILSFQRQPGSCLITWRSVAGGNYVVQFREHLTVGSWVDLRTLSSTGTTTSYLDTTANGSSQRFYRIVMRSAP
jgi:hypothetical protein